jgi:hypothetical protein
LSSNEIHSLASLLQKKKKLFKIRDSEFLPSSDNTRIDDEDELPSKPIETKVFNAAAFGYEEEEAEPSQTTITNPPRIQKPDQTSYEYLLERELISTIIQDGYLVDYDDIIPIRKVGEGAFAEVFEALLHNCDSLSRFQGSQSGTTTRKVAVKRLKGVAPNRVSQLKVFAREVSCLKRASQSCKPETVVNLIGACIVPHLCIVMDFVEGGSMADFLFGNNSLCISSQNKLTLLEALRCAIDIGEGIKQLHSLNPPIIHRDVHLQNVLVKLNTSPSATNKIGKLLLGDFGIARVRLF